MRGISFGKYQRKRGVVRTSFALERPYFFCYFFYFHLLLLSRRLRLFVLLGCGTAAVHEDH